MMTNGRGRTITKIATAGTLAIGLFALPACVGPGYDDGWNQSSNGAYSQPSYSAYSQPAHAAYRQPSYGTYSQPSYGTHQQSVRWAPPAQNQYNRYQHTSGGRILPFEQVRRELRQNGYRQISQLGMRGGDYVVGAVNHRGNPVRMLVDGRTLRVTNL